MVCTWKEIIGWQILGPDFKVVHEVKWGRGRNKHIENWEKVKAFLHAKAGVERKSRCRSESAIPVSEVD